MPGISGGGNIIVCVKLVMDGGWSGVNEVVRIDIVGKNELNGNFCFLLFLKAIKVIKIKKEGMKVEERNFLGQKEISGCQILFWGVLGVWMLILYSSS